MKIHRQFVVINLKISFTCLKTGIFEMKDSSTPNNTFTIGYIVYLFAPYSANIVFIENTSTKIPILVKYYVYNDNIWNEIRNISFQY